jgi:hypothetical protein
VMERFRFSLGDAVPGTARVRAALLYRRASWPLAEAKGWDVTDVLVRESVAELQVQGAPAAEREEADGGGLVCGGSPADGGLSLLLVAAWLGARRRRWAWPARRTRGGDA